METTQNEVSKAEFPIWKRIVLGTDYYVDPVYHCELNDFCHVAYFLLGSMCAVYDKPFFRLIRNIELIPIRERQDINLVLVSAEDLGFENDGIDYDDVLKSARNCGLKTCPIDVVFWLRYDYRDQPLGEILFVATELVKGSLYDFIFFIQNIGNYCNGYIGIIEATDGPFSPNGKRKLPFFGKKDRFVFCVE